MTEIERLLTGGSISLWLSFGMLNVGLAILKSRPVVISAKTMKTLLPLLLLPLSIMVTLWLVEESLAYVPDIPYLTLLVCTLLTIIVICVLWVLFFPQVFALYNVTGEMVMSCLVEILQKRGIQVALKETTSIINRASRISRMTVSLPETGSSIKVTLSVLGGAQLRFQGWHRILDGDAIIADFVNVLTTYRCGDSVVIGIELIFMGIGVIGIVLYALFDMIL